MKKPKNDAESETRAGGPKKKFGLSVREIPEIESPHLGLVRSLKQPADFPSPTDGAQLFDNRTPDENSTGRPDSTAPDATLEESKTPKLETIGRPLSAQPDAHSIFNRTSDTVTTGRPVNETMDAQVAENRTPILETTGRLNDTEPGVHDLKTATSNEQGTGRQMAARSGAIAPNVRDQAPSESREVGAKAPGSKNLGAHALAKEAEWEKNRSTERLALRPNGDILRKIKVFCAERNYTLSEFFELAGLKFIELGAQAAEDAGAKAPLDDLRLKIGLYKTRPTIINLYLAYTRRFNEHGDGKWSGKWMPRDDQAAAIFNDTDVRIVELGIIQTQANKGIGSGKIQTFQYYIPEIRGVLESGLGDNAIDVMINHHRNTLDRWFGKQLDLGFLEEGK